MQNKKYNSKMSIEERKKNMKNMKKVLFLFVAVLLTTVSVNAMSKDELKDKLTKSYTINGVTYKLEAGNANMVKTYLEQNEVSEADCDYIASQVDKAVEIVKNANVTDLSKLSTSSKNELKALVNNVGADTKVPVSIKNGKLFVGYVNEPEKAFFNDKVNVKTDVKYTNGNLVITIASVVAVIGIATIAVKAKKQNA